MTVYDIISKDLDKTTADSIAASLKAKGYTVSVSANTSETSTPTPVATSLKVGDMVMMQKNAPVYGTSKPFSSWIYSKELYVRAISGDRITVSIYKSGAISGNVDKKYLTKV